MIISKPRRLRNQSESSARRGSFLTVDRLLSGRGAAGESKRVGQTLA
jgi:hypothetical protein